MIKGLMIKNGLYNKKGDTVVFETVIFIVLNIIFFAALMFFVWKSASGAGVYEQTYAKQIALMIDGAKPEMTLYLDMSDGITIAQKKASKENIKNIVIIDQKNNRVIVDLSGKGKGYSFQYFSGYEIKSEMIGNLLRIIISDKKDDNDKT